MNEDLFTACARVGKEPLELGDASRPTSVPIVQSAAFAFDDLDALSDVQRGVRPGFQYTRIANPTTAAWEHEVAALEGADAAVGFASGMGAISASLLSCLYAGSHVVVAEQIYGVTYAFVTQTLARFGVRATFVDIMDERAVALAMTPDTRVVLAETISNPTLLVPALPALAEIAHKGGAKLIVDNTFATPMIAKPLSWGADIVVHSATKYLNGHSDVSAGIALGNRATVEELQKTAWLLGATLDPMASWLLLRGLKTFAIRFSRQCETAALIAARLRSHPQVARVYHPGAGAIVSFEPKAQPGEDGLLAAKRVVKAMAHVAVVPSLGGVATTATHPVSTSHRAVPAELRARLGVTDALLRLSIGLEDAETLWREVEAACKF